MIVAIFWMIVGSAITLVVQKVRGNTKFKEAVAEEVAKAKANLKAKL